MATDRAIPLGAHPHSPLKRLLAPGAWEVINAARLKAPNVPARPSFGQPDTTPYENVSVPTLLLVGAEDKLRDPGYHEVMVERIPEVHAIVVDGAGHLLNIEKAEVFDRAVVEFLSTPAEQVAGGVAS